MTTSDSDREPDAKATVQQNHRPITVERYGDQLIVEGPRDGRLELEAPDEATLTATAIQAVIPKTWKDDHDTVRD